MSRKARRLAVKNNFCWPKTETNMTFFYQLRNNCYCIFHFFSIEPDWDYLYSYNSKFLSKKFCSCHQNSLLHIIIIHSHIILYLNSISTINYCILYHFLFLFHSLPNYPSSTNYQTIDSVCAVMPYNAVYSVSGFLLRDSPLQLLFVLSGFILSFSSVGRAVATADSLSKGKLLLHNSPIPLPLNK